LPHQKTLHHTCKHTRTVSHYFICREIDDDDGGGADALLPAVELTLWLLHIIIITPPSSFQNFLPSWLLRFTMFSPLIDLSMFIASACCHFFA